jgi:ATP-dependent Clp protease ATP-binding subunit ClpA
LILGLLHAPDSIAGQALLSCGLRLEIVREQFLDENNGCRGALMFGATAKSALEGALRKALAHRADSIEPEHVLLAVLECDEGRLTSILSLAGTTLREVGRMIALIQADRFQPAILSGLVREYHRESRLDEFAVARVERVFRQAGT